MPNHIQIFALLNNATKMFYSVQWEKSLIESFNHNLIHFDFFFESDLFSDKLCYD